MVRQAWSDAESLALLDFIWDHRQHARSGGDTVGFGLPDALWKEAAPVISALGTARTPSSCCGRWGNMKDCYKAITQIKARFGWDDERGANIGPESAAGWKSFSSRVRYSNIFRNKGWTLLSRVEPILLLNLPVPKQEELLTEPMSALGLWTPEHVLANGEAVQPHSLPPERPELTTQDPAPTLDTEIIAPASARLNNVRRQARPLTANNPSPHKRPRLGLRTQDTLSLNTSLSRVEWAAKRAATAVRTALLRVSAGHRTRPEDFEIFMAAFLRMGQEDGDAEAVAREQPLAVALEGEGEATICGGAIANQANISAKPPLKPKAKHSIQLTVPHGQTQAQAQAQSRTGPTRVRIVRPAQDAGGVGEGLPQPQQQQPQRPTQLYLKRDAVLVNAETQTLPLPLAPPPLLNPSARKTSAITRAQLLETHLSDAHIVALVELFQENLDAADAYLAIRADREGVRRGWVWNRVRGVVSEDGSGAVVGAAGEVTGEGRRGG